jgi:hypothetical protein
VPWPAVIASRPGKSSSRAPLRRTAKLLSFAHAVAAQHTCSPHLRVCVRPAYAQDSVTRPGSALDLRHPRILPVRRRCTERWLRLQVAVASGARAELMGQLGGAGRLVPTVPESEQPDPSLVVFEVLLPL